MKTTLLVLTVAGLSGCAVYPVPTYPTYPTYGGGPPMVVEQPVYIEGGYQRRGYANDYPRGFSRPAPVVVLPVAPRPRYPHRDPDRDGDGVRDRFDRWPGDPRRR
ncbi:hypothetical protein [Polaromonas sp.]|uniref:hypothetical protein n=1 Tax=Polaromonas sp. TaxID=1869339 RepID=UPI002489B01C|nr:hypothetical protein [Polaromonas sp.]MDI1271972.1 hypothetical protein [Polaromonas sp.]